jgi:hypothetical protein
MLAVADVVALQCPDALDHAIILAGCARITLCARRDIWVLVDADDWPWLCRHRWNIGWHAKTKWKLYAKRNEGPARSTIYLHREVLIRASGCEADFAAAHHGHHLNGQSLDCRQANLGWRTPAANSAIRVKRIGTPSLEAIVAALARQAGAAEVPY